MAQDNAFKHAQRACDTFIAASARNKTIPIIIASAASRKRDLQALSSAQRVWLKSVGFGFAAGEFQVVADEKGDIGCVVCGADGPPLTALNGEEIAPAACFAAGALAAALPQGDYHFEDCPGDPELLALAWALGAYDFTTYRNEAPVRRCRLKLDKGVDRTALEAIVTGNFLGRDLINTPANDLGPDELEQAARTVAKAFGAKTSVVTGDDLLAENFPMIHAVGRASDRAPRLIELRWGAKKHPAVTLVGKGIVFDTGGLNLKPGSSMALMKKDMGGAATALALAAMVMGADLPVQLRVLLPTAENAVSANAYRPGDVLASRNGMTVEIGNTDAEGRLVLADALALADENPPDALFCFATLTGAARVALGPDLPPLYATDDALAEDILEAASAVHDPLWRMPLWQPYDQTLRSAVADVSHISNGPFAGSVTAALFLNRFVENTAAFAHIDLYGWVPVAKSGFPKGGEPQSARAVFETLRKRYGDAT